MGSRVVLEGTGPRSRMNKKAQEKISGDIGQWREVRSGGKKARGRSEIQSGLAQARHRSDG